MRVWDASTGETLKELKGHTDSVWSVAFSTDGGRIVSGSGDKSVRVWDASTGEMLKVLEGHTDSVWSVAFSTDGGRIVSGSGRHSRYEYGIRSRATFGNVLISTIRDGSFLPLEKAISCSCLLMQTWLTPSASLPYHVLAALP